MATIYDMSTGRIIAANEYAAGEIPPADIPSPEAALQTIEAGTAIEDMAPVDAYMVMLQELLKKL